MERQDHRTIGIDIVPDFSVLRQDEREYAEVATSDSIHNKFFGFFSGAVLNMHGAALTILDEAEEGAFDGARTGVSLAARQFALNSKWQWVGKKQSS